MNCPVCQNTTTTNFLVRSKVPVHQNLLMQDIASALALGKGELTLSYCKMCSFVFNSTFSPELLSYGERYDNNQACSPLFGTYTKDLADHLISKQGVRNCRIVEVGCGNGYFLKKLVADKELNNTGFGFDPSYRGPEAEYDGRLNFYKSYYDENCANIQADVVICRHVIEHVTDPVSLLRTIKKALINSPKAKIFFETPRVEWILGNVVVWDFFYEHCSYFSEQSITSCFENAGFNIVNINKVFGEQYMWVEASMVASSKRFDFLDMNSLIQNYTGEESRIRKYWMNQIDMYSNDGLAVWGAGAKGVTFMNLFDSDRKNIKCVIDLNLNKQNKYIPGTGHSIVSPEEANQRGIKRALVMNPNYLNENMALIKKNRLNLELIT